MARKCYRNLRESFKNAMVSIIQFLLIDGNYLKYPSITIKIDLTAFA